MTTAKGAAFDFDSFTLESVRATTSLHKPTSDKSDGGESAGLSSHAQKLAAAMDAQPSDLASSFHTMRSTEDFDALESRHRNPSTASSGISSTGAVSTVVGAPTVMFKRVTHATELAASRKKTTVLMSGWLQKRKGLVLKRWKAFYCLLRDDDHLCLYTSEDTVNGRVEQRFQLLRVLLTDKSDAFHVIGVGADGTPRKEEFRALHSVDWAAWFRRGFRDYLDAVSLQGVLARKPELLLPESPSASRSEDSYGDDEVGNDNQRTHDRRVLSSRRHQQQQQYGERQSIGSSRQQSQKNSLMRRESYDTFSETTRSTISTFSGVSSWTNQSEDTTKNQEEASAISDCPMIDPRDWQLPILESARGSESTTSLRSSDVVKPSAFSWSS